MKRPAVRFLFLLPALSGSLLPALLRAVHHAHDPRLLTTLTALAVAGVVGYGLLVWKLVIEAHRHAAIGALFGEEK